MSHGARISISMLGKASRRLSVFFFVLFISGTILGAQVVPFPQTSWQVSSPAAAGMDLQYLNQARLYALQGGGSGMVVRGGSVVYEWGDRSEIFQLKSTTKSIASLALGLAIGDGLLSLGMKVADFHPSFGNPPGTNLPWLADISFRQLAGQVAGFGENGGYEPLLFEPGSQWYYSNCGPNWLAESLTLLYLQDMHTFLSQRVFDPLQIAPAQLLWRDNNYRDHLISGVANREFSSGISASADALARIGYLLLRNGAWQGQQILEAEFIADLRTSQFSGAASLTPLGFENASDHYGLLWWNNSDGTLTNVPLDAYWSWGLFESLIVVIPSLDLVISRVGPNGWRPGWDADYAVLAPFLDPICQSIIKDSAAPLSLEYTSCTWQTDLEFVGVGNEAWILAQESNGDYLASFTQGTGLQLADACVGQTAVLNSQSLANGLARFQQLTGLELCGTNFSSPTGERMGTERITGLLSYDTQAAMWMSEFGFTRLHTSSDQGASWTLAAGVQFLTSFGQASFVQAGPGYADAVDDYLYVLAQDAPQDQSASSLVLARVSQDQLTNMSAFDYFAGLDQNDQPIWSSQQNLRQPILSDPLNCLYSSMNYFESIDSYVLWMGFPSADPANAGGFALYHAAQPYGPFELLFVTHDWDMGPGVRGQVLAVEDGPESLTLTMAFAASNSLVTRKALLTKLQKITLVGDVNGDGSRDISDVIYLLGYLFSGSVEVNPATADVNQDGSIDLADAIVLLNELFAP